MAPIPGWLREVFPKHTTAVHLLPQFHSYLLTQTGALGAVSKANQNTPEARDALMKCYIGLFNNQDGLEQKIPLKDQPEQSPYIPANGEDAGEGAWNQSTGRRGNKPPKAQKPEKAAKGKGKSKDENKEENTNAPGKGKDKGKGKDGEQGKGSPQDKGKGKPQDGKGKGSQAEPEPQQEDPEAQSRPSLRALAL